MNSDEKATAFVKTFQSFTREQQNNVLKQILGKCQPLQLRLLHSELKPLLAVDFVAFLPKELSERIFSYLPVKSLCCVAQCSRLWRERANHNGTWYRLCVERGWDKFGEDLLETSQVSTPPIVAVVLKPLICRWKDIFIRANALKENWVRGRYTVAPLLRGHKEPINAFACNGSIIVSGSSDNTARVWDVKTMRCIYVFDSPHTDSVRCIGLKDSLFVSGCADCVIRLFHLKSGRCIRSFHGHTGGVEHLSFDGSIIISASTDLTVRVWNVDVSQPIHTLTGHSDEIQVLVQRGDLAITASWDETIRLWNIQSGTCLLTLRGHTEAVYCCDFNEKKIISGGGDGLVKIWDARTGENTFTLIGHTGEVYCVQFNDCVIASGSADSTVCIWNHHGMLLHSLKEHIGVVRCLCLSGARLISGGDRKRIAVWDVKEGKMLSVVHRNPSLLHLMWADDTKLITASPETPGTITVISYW